MNTPDKRFDLLKKQGFHPSVIYDIGSHIGEWTTQFSKIFPNSTFHLFEANRDHEKICYGPHVHYVLLGNTDDRIVTYHKSTSENIFWTTGNSIYKENNIHGCEYIPIEMKMKRLDTFVKEHNLPLPEMIKLDTQGSELQILQGAPETLKHVNIILMEISLHQWNDGGPLIHDVIVEMDKLGFVLIDIPDFHYVNDVLIQIDGIFCKKDSDFFYKQF